MADSKGNSSNKNGKNGKSNEQNNNNNNKNTNVEKTTNTNDKNNTTKTIDKKKTLGTSPRLLIDSFVGVFAGFSLSWFITPMDKSVIENMNGVATIGQSLRNSSKQMAQFWLLFIFS